MQRDVVESVLDAWVRIAPHNGSTVDVGVQLFLETESLHVEGSTTLSGAIDAINELKPQRVSLCRGGESVILQHVNKCDCAGSCKGGGYATGV